MSFPRTLSCPKWPVLFLLLASQNSDDYSLQWQAVKSVQRSFNEEGSLMWKNEVGVCHLNGHIKIRTRHLPGIAVLPKFGELSWEVRYFQAYTTGAVLSQQT